MPDIKESIPLVDLGEIGLSHEPDPTDEEWQRVGKDINEALTTFGFTYLANHGFSDEVVNDTMEAGEAFFNLPREEKEKWPRDLTTLHGYAGPGREILDPKLPIELKESFDIRNGDDFYPDEEVPSLRTTSRTFLETCWSLSERLMTAFAIGQGYDRDIFLDTHKRVGMDGNNTIGRLLHYPPVPEDTKKDALRCGIHADYGTLTLLFQDDMGGLKVRNRDGEFVDANNVPGAILMLTGDLMEVWTSKRWLAAEHKVIIPEDEIRKRRSRRSMAYFVMPDDEVLIRPLDGSQEIEPTTGAELMKKRLEATHTY